MESEEVRKSNRQNFWFGIVIGAISAAVVCVLVLCLGLFGVFGDNFLSRRGDLYLGKDVTYKMNTLISVIDQYFLYDYDQEAMENAIYDGIMSSIGDPYSAYYTPEEYADMMASSEGIYYGIGVAVTQDVETGDCVVVQPYEGSPGEEAGILPDDIIEAVNGTVITGMDLDLAVDLIKGDEGTTVTLTIVRGSEKFDVEVERRKIDIVTIASEMLEDDIGYIQISEFDVVTISQFKAALDELIADGMKGLIIDIRSNPGGRLDAVTEMLDYILPEGLIVYTEDKNGSRNEFYSDAETALNVPCAVLVNGHSASASEIFAGAMQDYGLAEIIGTQTYGKGIVQTIMELSDGSAMKLTIEDYYTPNGNNIHGIGITPDQVVELDSEAYLEDGTDSQLEAAITYIEEQSK